VNRGVTFERSVRAAAPWRRESRRRAPERSQYERGVTKVTSSENPNVKDSAVQNRGGKNLVILPQEAAVTKPIWPMRGWHARG